MRMAVGACLSGGECLLDFLLERLGVELPDLMQLLGRRLAERFHVEQRLLVLLELLPPPQLHLRLLHVPGLLRRHRLRVGLPNLHVQLRLSTFVASVSRC